MSAVRRIAIRLDEPVWIATVFHLVNFYDDNNRITLPRDIVIETGSTKEGLAP